ncbi:MAG: hypothetical protein LBT04_03360 [Prevotellaceae bacterium]|jgi:hypothetical protein|nr:hypothetical protein [Prevotellaceae bacterium]
MIKIERVYDVKLNYEQGKSDPFIVFSAYAEIVQSFSKIDNLLGKSLNFTTICKLTLEDVLSGSIISKIKAWLECKENSLTADTVPEKEDFQNYVDESAGIFIDTLNRETVESRDQIKALQTNLDNVAKKTKISNIITYTAPPLKSILNVANDFSKSVMKLSDTESVSYQCKSNAIPIKKNISVAFDKIQEEFAEKTLITEGEMLLKIKKPDLLGNTLWLFKHDRPIQAHIEDSEWLKEFLDAEIPLFSGDSLLAHVKIIQKYDIDDNLLKQEYFITKVNKKITGEHNG